MTMFPLKIYSSNSLAKETTVTKIQSKQ